MTKSELIEKYAEEIWTVSADSTKKSEYADILTRLLSEYDAQRGVEGWHREAAKDINMEAALGMINEEFAAEFIAKHDPHAPASSATREVIERYANEIVPYTIREVTKEEARTILTRFASEITVDAEKVEDAIRTIGLLIAPAEAQTSRMLASVRDVLRSIKSAGGGKND